MRSEQVASVAFMSNTRPRIASAHEIYFPSPEAEADIMKETRLDKLTTRWFELMQEQAKIEEGTLAILRCGTSTKNSVAKLAFPVGSMYEDRGFVCLKFCVVHFVIDNDLPFEPIKIVCPENPGLESSIHKDWLPTKAWPDKLFPLVSKMELAPTMVARVMKPEDMQNKPFDFKFNSMWMRPLTSTS